MKQIENKADFRELSLKSLATCALIIQTYNIFWFYVSVTMPLEILETAISSSISGYIKTRNKGMSYKTLDPDMMNEVAETVILQNPNLKNYVSDIKRNITQTYQNHLEKIEKGQKELTKENALENSFLSLHKLNHASVDRLCATYLMADGRYKDYGLQILRLKNTITSSLQAYASVSKTAGYIVGYKIGYSIATIENTIWSYTDKENQDALSKCVENFSLYLNHISPAVYLGYNIYKVVCKAANKGIQVSFIPLAASTVMCVGFIAGMVEIADGKQADIISSFEKNKDKTWSQLFNVAVNSSTALSKNIIVDFKTAYNFALTKQEKFLNVIEKDGIKGAIDVKPQKSGRDLLYLSTVSEALNSDENIYINQRCITTTFEFNAMCKAVLAVSAKILYQSSKQVGQIAFESIKFTNNVVDNFIHR